jgi:hypothetical protein
MVLGGYRREGGAMARRFPLQTRPYLSEWRWVEEKRRRVIENEVTNVTVDHRAAT